MKNYTFNYVKYFNCLGSECKHNCCTKWDVVIDKPTLKKYQNLFKSDERFSSECFDGNKFKLNESGRCPFLDDDNLCYIIKNYGEKALCKTCKTHPRFRSFFSSYAETGLGLCCEHAGKIILSFKPKMKLASKKGDNFKPERNAFEKKIFLFRNKALKIAQSKNLTIYQKLESLSELTDINLFKKSYLLWTKTLLSLESLDEKEFSFNKLTAFNEWKALPQNYDREFEQLLSYLIFRHVSRAIDQIDLRVRLSFVLLSIKIINQIYYLLADFSFDGLVEACRIYSSEIECSDDNLFILLNEIESLVSLI